MKRTAFNHQTNFADSNSAKTKQLFVMGQFYLFIDQLQYMKQAQQAEEANNDNLPEQPQFLVTPTRSPARPFSKGTGISLPNFNFAHLLSPPSKIKEHQIELISSQEKKLKDNQAVESPSRPTAFRNPYARFFNDSNSKMINEENELRQAKREASSFRRRLIESFNSSAKEVEEKNLKMDVEERALKEIDPSKIKFFPEESEAPAKVSKLLWFKPNRKNGRYLKWNSKLMCCEPSYKCFGCDREFEVPSALGGHLSRCQFRSFHEDIVAGKEPKKTKEQGNLPCLMNQQRQKLRPKEQKQPQPMLLSFHNSQYNLLAEDQYQSEIKNVKKQASTRKKKRLRKMPKNSTTITNFYNLRQESSSRVVKRGVRQQLESRLMRQRNARRSNEQE